jgi:hypothetical protein
LLLVLIIVEFASVLIIANYTERMPLML